MWTPMPLSIYTIRNHEPFIYLHKRRKTRRKFRSFCLRIQTSHLFVPHIFLQMRPSFVVSLLLLLLLLTKAQGIRLGKESLPIQQQKQHKEKTALLKRSNSDADGEAILCEDEQCTGRIKKRKLVTAPVSTTYTISKNVNRGENEGDPLVNSNITSMKVNGETNERKVNKVSTTSKNQNQQQEQYPDLEDITEMDYSPATRKPPIHN
ncbi:hypothetical protein Lalb_Chr07g0179441 [Lupinus albus]|uniref:Uncharacterized protein n=1 Tax=Lupinus albus TaxID=3870 RepID=A0A6A4Q785_LUPAL|nr:hypothetical protein Lalb_Chr07g0179441 [Lupinus albus]